MKLATTTMFALSCAAAAPIAAQSPNALLFSPKGAMTTRSLSGGTAKLSQIGASSAGLVIPDSAGSYSAEKFAPGLGWQTLIGDEDGDGDVHSSGAVGGIDAVMVKPEFDRRTRTFTTRTDVNWLDIYFSPKNDIGTHVSGAPGLRRGDCGKFVRTPAGNGQVEHFIRAEHLISVFGLMDAAGQPIGPARVNIDAITMDEEGNIFVSFEDDHTMRLNYGSGVITQAIGDGGVAWIPPAAWTPDIRGNVGSVIPNDGRLGLAESTTSGWTARANPGDANGACVSQLSDLDGLAIDPNGGTFSIQWATGSTWVPNLLYCGEELTGGAVLSTDGYGTIATLNGIALANACGYTTSGDQLGVQATGSVGSLDGLCVLPEPPTRFVLDSSTPTGLGGAIDVEIGSDLGAPAVWLMLGLGTLPVSPSLDFSAVFPNTRGFPELYPAVLSFNVAVAMTPDGYGGRVGQWSLPWSVPFANGLLFQAVTLSPWGLELSSPVTLH